VTNKEISTSNTHKNGDKTSTRDRDKVKIRTIKDKMIRLTSISDRDKPSIRVVKTLTQDKVDRINNNSNKREVNNKIKTSDKTMKTTTMTKILT